MKVLITGKNGQVGHDLVKSAPKGMELFAFNHGEMDITNRNALAERLEEIRPDIVINAAAYTAVDKAEKETDMAYQVNAIGAGYLAALCSEFSMRLIHLSTDFVFDGRKNSPYLPDDKLNPLSVYGKSKAEGERLVKDAYADNSIIVRSSWIYSINGHNFVKTMLGMMKSQDEIRVVSDQIGSPTWSRNLALVLWSMITNPVQAGIYHWSDAGVASWYDYAIAIHEEAYAIGLIARDVNILPVSTEQYPSAATRPACSVMDTAGTRKLWGVKSEHWRKALRKMLVEYHQLIKLSDELVK